MTDCVTTALDAKIAQFQTDVDLVHQIVQGDATVEVATDNGPIPSIAKVIATITNDLQTVGPFEELAADPPLSGLTSQGRFWFNTTDLAIRFAFLNSAMVPEVHTVVDRQYLADQLNSLKVSLESEINGIDSSLTTEITQEVSDRKAAIQALQAEVDAIEAAAGLNADGTLAPITGTNYINSAASLLAALTALDTQLKQTNDQLGTISTTAGPAGPAGESAYQIAVDNGFVGTQQQWLASLVGAAGTNGTNGESAYQLAVDSGFVGTESQWLASLVGAQGPIGPDGATGPMGPQGAIDIAIGCTLNGKPGASQMLLCFPATSPINFAAGLTRSQAVAGTAATADVTFSITKNGTQVGTINFAAGAAVATFTAAAAFSLATGDVLRVIAPATQDTTLADLGLSVLGTR